MHTRGPRPRGAGMTVPAARRRLRNRHAPGVICRSVGSNDERSPRALLRTDTPAPQPGAEVHGVAGIGDPARFFAALRALGWRVREHAFADHHAYVQADFGFDEGTLPIVMTEKDAVKCAAFAQPHWWALPACAELPADFFSAVLARLPAARCASHGRAG